MKSERQDVAGTGHSSGIRLATGKIKGNGKRGKEKK